MLTPETLTRHELVGLPVRVADAPNTDLVGIAGRVVRETAGTLVVRDPSGSRGGSRDRQVPKRATTFEFRLVPAAELTAGEQQGTDDRPGAGPEGTDDRAGVRPASTDEAASGREAAGDASEREGETAGVRPGQSRSTVTGSGAAAQAAGTDREGAVYVTVDGTRLLSRPALRTETAGDTTWQSD